MASVDWEALEPFWKPLEGIEYPIVVCNNWRSDTRTFNEKPAKVLVLNVLQVGDKVFSAPKEFSTKSYAFITQVRPIIERAESEGRKEIYVAVRREGKKYSVFDISQTIMSHIQPAKSFPGVKLGP